MSGAEWIEPVPAWTKQAEQQVGVLLGALADPVDPSEAEQLVSVFVVAARLLAAGATSRAVNCLLPRDRSLVSRVPAMVAVGAVLTAHLPVDAARSLVDRVAVRDVIAAERGEHVLLGVLVDLLVRWAAMEAST